jgi:hypothetical protein
MGQGSSRLLVTSPVDGFAIGEVAAATAVSRVAFEDGGSTQVIVSRVSGRY